jgi:glutamyl-tRNA reductase
MQKTGLRPDARILMVGAGETNALFAKFLTKAQFRNVTVFNRTFEKAQALAQANGWRAFPLDELAYFSEGFDALVVCTGATQAIIEPALYRELLAGETGKKVVVDLSIPYNVARETVEAFPMQYIEIESLKETASENLAYREQEREHAAGLIQERILQFRDRWHERQVERSMAHIPDEVKAVKERAINEVFGKEFAQLDPAAQDLVQRMLGYMEKKCVAIPIKAAKAIALRGQKKTCWGNGSAIIAPLFPIFASMKKLASLVSFKRKTMPPWLAVRILFYPPARSSRPSQFRVLEFAHCDFEYQRPEHSRRTEDRCPNAGD